MLLILIFIGRTEFIKNGGSDVIIQNYGDSHNINTLSVLILIVFLQIKKFAEMRSTYH